MPQVLTFNEAGATGGGVPSTSIVGLSSRQVLFGSSVGGIAQDALFQYDSTDGRLGIGTSAPTARFTAIPSAAGEATYDWYTTAGVHSGRINSSGHAGFGTTAPTAAVHARSNTTNTASLVAQFNTGQSGNVFEVQNSSGQVFAQATVLGLFGAGDGTTAAAGFNFRGDANNGIYRQGSDRWAAIAGGQDLVIFETTGTTQKVTVGASTVQTVAFFGSAGSTRTAPYVTTGTTLRTMNSTITPAAVYTSDVGAQLNALQGVVKTIIQDLAANVGYGLFASTA